MVDVTQSRIMPPWLPEPQDLKFADELRLSDAQIAAIEKRIRELQERAGYTSDYDSWIAKVTPADLE